MVRRLGFEEELTSPITADLQLVGVDVIVPVIRQVEDVRQRGDAALRAFNEALLERRQSGTTYLTDEIRLEILKDLALRSRQGWSIHWVFEGGISEPLESLLDALEIDYVTGGQIDLLNIPER